MKLTPTQKRLLFHFNSGKTLSIKTMWQVRISNCSREIRRQLEIPFGIELQRETIRWKDSFGSGYYFEYSLNPNDLEKINGILKAS